MSSIEIFFDFMTRQFWLVAIAVSFLNAGIIWVQSRPHVGKNPALAPGYAAIVRSHVTWLNLPWIVMGIGITMGGVPSIADYFRPQDKDPYVLVWWGTIFALLLLAYHWIFFRRGAEWLAQYPAAFRGQQRPNPTVLKFTLLVMLIFEIVFFMVLWSQN